MVPRTLIRTKNFHVFATLTIHLVFISLFTLDRHQEEDYQGKTIVDHLQTYIGIICFRLTIISHFTRATRNRLPRRRPPRRRPPPRRLLPKRRRRRPPSPRLPRRHPPKRRRRRPPSPRHPRRHQPKRRRPLLRHQPPPRNRRQGDIFHGVGFSLLWFESLFIRGLVVSVRVYHLCF